MTTSTTNVTITVTPRELNLIINALHIYLDDFGHDEADVRTEIRTVIAKVNAAAQPAEPPA